MIVLKFGGSSVGTPERVQRCIDIVKEQLSRRPVIVVSAHGKTTDNLIASAKRAFAGAVDTERVRAYHKGLIEGLGVDQGLVDPLISDLENLLQGISLIKELTPRTLDHVMSFGERLASRIFARAMTRQGIPAVPVNSFDLGLITDSAHGSATPLKGIEEGIRKNIALINDVPVITGFIAKDEKGDITTLGRSGSDYTASLVGAAIGAEEIQVWKDVDGVMTADPSVCDKARNLPVMSFEEASELSYYGAEVLHPSTLIPAMARKIPVRVANTLKPEDPGTMILADSRLVDRIAKSIVYKEDLCLIHVLSQTFNSATRLLSAALDILDRHNIGIHVAATSESSVSFVTDRPYSEDELRNAFAELERIGMVSFENEKALICLVGEELKGNPRVLGDIFTTVGKAGINARMVSQSASEINVAFLVENSQIADAVVNLHNMLLEHTERT